MSTFPGVLGGDRFARALAQARRRSVEAGRRIATGARRWLRGDAWTAEDLRRLAAVPAPRWPPRRWRRSRPLRS